MFDETANVVYGHFCRDIPAEATVMTKVVDLTKEEVARYFSYDPLAGSLIRLERSGQRGRVGEDATSIRRARDGRGQDIPYRWVWLHGVIIPAARVAWLLTYGEWPSTRVLYKSGDTLDIRIENLKLGEYRAVKVGKQYRRTREDGRSYNLKNVYGMTMGEHEHMLASQGDVCKLCGQHEIRKHKDGAAVALHVDHDHKTGKVRGLLCHKCNIGLGSFNDDPALLRKGAEYLESFNADVAPLERAS